jgi:hypothetical protein
VDERHGAWNSRPGCGKPGGHFAHRAVWDREEDDRLGPRPDLTNKRGDATSGGQQLGVMARRGESSGEAAADVSPAGDDQIG